MSSFKIIPLWIIAYPLTNSTKNIVIAVFLALVANIYLLLYIFCQCFWIYGSQFLYEQIGKQCKPVQVHSFSRISLQVILRKFACWGSVPNPLWTPSSMSAARSFWPFHNLYAEHKYHIGYNEKEKTWTAEAIQVNYIPNYFLIHSMKVATFFRSSSLKLLNCSQSLR